MLLKYLSRLGIVGAGLAGALLALSGILSYKLQLVILGAGAAEAFWITWFRPVLGPIENRKGVELVALCVLRGVVLLSFILGLTLGL